MTAAHTAAARPRWRDLAQLRAIHAMLAAEHPAISPKLDETRLIKALAKPRALVQSGTEPVAIAAAYAAAVVDARPVAAGNGALALAVLDVVLRLSGRRLDAPETEAVAAFRELESGSIGAAEIEAWARTKSVAL